MIPIKFIRSLDGTNPVYGNHAADQPVAKAIARWCREIRLAGATRDLKVTSSDVFQLTSGRMYNRHVYVASVSDRKMLLHIVQDLADKAGTPGGLSGKCELPDDPVAGLVYLQRHIYRAPVRPVSAASRLVSLDDSDAALPRSVAPSFGYRVEDIYWLTIFDSQGRPAVNVHHDSASCTYVSRRAINNPVEYAAELGEYFPQPDEVIIDWHDMAEVLGWHRRIGYLQAVCADAGVRRDVLARNSHGTLRVYGGDPNGGLEYTRYAGAAFTSSTILNAYTWNPVSGVGPLIPPEVPVDSAAMTVRQPDVFVLPRPAYVGNLLAQRLVEGMGGLQQSSASFSTYLGQGLFSVRTSQLETLAAGSGNWGSGESLPLFVLQAAIEGGGLIYGTAGSVGFLVAGGADLWRSANADLIAQDREWCRTHHKSTADCVSCVVGGTPEGASMFIEGAAGAFGVTMGIAAALSATGIGLPIGIALAVIGGVVVAANIGVNYHSIEKDCAGKRS